jgi:GTP-binding protein
VSGLNVGDLLDAIFQLFHKLKRPPRPAPPVPAIAVAIMGRPNVGKSSLFNQLIGEERVIVSPTPHTTREPHDTLVEVAGDHLLFIDTAGIRRQAKVVGELERGGIAKSIATIKRAEVVLLVLDTTEAVSHQDKELARLLTEHSRSVIIVINKWDRAEDNSDQFRNQVKTRLQAELPHLNWAPVVFTSALTGYRVHQLFPLIKQAAEARRLALSAPALSEWLKRVTAKRLPTRGRGVRHPRLLGLTQVHVNPPIFELKIKAKTSVHISYVHYLENQLRQQFGWFACPLVIKLTKVKR